MNRLHKELISFSVFISLAMTARITYSAPRPCFDDSECIVETQCLEGFCRAPCEGDIDCENGYGCLLGGCFKESVSHISPDVGLSENDYQPGCESSDDCRSEKVLCDDGVCRQQIYVKENDVLTLVPRECSPSVDGVFSLQPNLCVNVGSYSCKQAGQMAYCEGPTCNSDQDCVDSWPLAPEFECIHGRCTTACDSDSECCGPQGLCPGENSQSSCTVPPFETAGYCVEDKRQVKTRLLYEGNEDPRNVNTLFILGEGFSTQDELDDFYRIALKFTRYLTTRVDVHNAIFRNRYNIYGLAAPSKNLISDFNNPTVFGWSIDERNVPINGVGTTKYIRGASLDALGWATRQWTEEPVPVAIQQLLDNRLSALVVFNTGKGARGAAKGGRVVITPMVLEDGIQEFSDSEDITSLYWLASHEFAHTFGLRDEYVNTDIPNNEEDSSCELSEPKNYCNFPNVLPRVIVNPSCSNCDDPATDCKGTSDGAWMPTFENEPPWRDYFTSDGFPTTSQSPISVGLYEGGLNSYPKKIMRSQHTCHMNLGRDFYCVACSRFMAHRSFLGVGGLARLLSVPGCVQQPSMSGLGPHRGVAVSETGDRVFFTRSFDGQAQLLEFDTRLVQFGTTNNGLDTMINGAAVPERIFIDEANSKTLMVRMEDDPGSNGLIVYNNTDGTWEGLDVSGLGSIYVHPDQSRLFGFRYDESNSDLVKFDLGPNYQQPVPLGLGPLPPLQITPVRGRTAELLFFPVLRQAPVRSVCGPDSCQVLVFDENSEDFLPEPLLVEMGAGGARGVRGVAAGTPLAGPEQGNELFIAASNDEIFIWLTEAVQGGATDPAYRWQHTLFGDIHAVEFDPSTGRVWLGGSGGRVRSYTITGADEEDMPSSVGIQVREIRALPGGVAVVRNSFGGLRTGDIKILSSTGMEVLVDQPTAGATSSPVTLATHERFGLLFSAAVMDSGDRLHGTADENLCGQSLLGGPFKIPVFVTPDFEYPNHPAEVCELEDGW